MPAIADACASARVPFAAVYLIDESGEELSLIGINGQPPAGWLPPVTVDLLRDDSSWPWPMSHAFRTQRYEEAEDVPGGGLIVPIPSATHDSLAGLLLVGKEHGVGELPRSLLDLVASHIGITLVRDGAVPPIVPVVMDDLLPVDAGATARLHEFSMKFRRVTEMLPVLEHFVDAVMAVQKAHRGELFLFNRETQSLNLVVRRGDARVEGEPQGLLQSTPLLDSSGDPIGVLSTYAYGVDRTGERERRVMDLYARLVAAVLERNRFDRERQEWLGRTLSAQEAERRRISRELHDTVGQHVTGLLLGLKPLERPDMLPPGEAADIAKRLAEIAETIGREVHELAADMRPAALDDFGIVRALSTYAADWSRRTGIVMDFHAAGWDDRRVAPSVEDTLYRIVLEALNNVVKHASATCVSLSLERRGDDAVAIIEDNGKGFELDKVDGGGRRRLGLLGMQERAALVGGTAMIESTIEQGTAVLIRIPQAAKAQGAMRGI